MAKKRATTEDHNVASPSNAAALQGTLAVDDEGIIKIEVKEQIQNAKLTELLEKTLGRMHHEKADDREGAVNVTQQEIIIFDSDEAGAITAEKAVQALGFPRTLHVTDISLVLARLRHGQTKGVFVAYHGSGHFGPLLIQEVLEMRDLHRINLFLIADSEDVGRKFHAKYSHLMVDGVVNRAEPKQTLRPKIWQLWSHQHSEQKLMDALFDLRTIWRAQRAGMRKVSINEQHLQEQTTLLQQSSTSYLALSEVFLKDLMRGRQDNVHSLAIDLKKWTELSVDVVLSLGAFMAITQTPDEAADWLLDQALGHRLFCTEKAYALGKMLVKWRALKQLKALLEQWNMRPDLACDANFYYIMSQYFKCHDRSQEEMACIKQAVGHDPLAIDHVAGLADTYARQDNPAMAEAILKVLAATPLPSEFGLRHRYVQYLYDRERFEVCREAIVGFQKIGMGNPLFDELLRNIEQKAA